MALPIPLRRGLEWIRSGFRRSRPGKRRRIPGRPLAFFLGSLLLLVAVGVALFAHYGRVVTEKMEGRRWNLPTRLWSDVWVVRPGDAVSRDDVERRLGRLGYVVDPGKGPLAPGRYRLEPGRLLVAINDRETAWGRFPGLPVRLDFSGRRLAAVQRVDDGGDLPFAVFEPELIGSKLDPKTMEDRTPITLERVPQELVDAIVATEDRDFFSHQGISLKRILGAALRDLRRGGVLQGGSTLTQQLVKNMFRMYDRTLRRKVVEAVMAIVLDFKYDKKVILEAYLNEIYLGQRGSVSVTGVEEAAKFYFGKPAAQMNLPECAMLAGLIASPGRFSPFRSPDRARERRALVLRGMRETGKIEESAYRAALDAPLTALAKPPTGVDAPHFFDFVRSQVKELPLELKEEDGLSIFTTLDPEMQAAAQASVLKGLEDLEKRFKRLRAKEGEGPLQAALIALDPATGSVKALVGGRDYQVSQFNRVVQARRQPGSLFKPFVYLAAFSRRDLATPITPATQLLDTPITVAWGSKPDETWSPKNYDGEFRGPVSVRTALEDSRNIPTVRVAVTPVPEGTLLTDVVACARRAGVTSPLMPYPSVALGSFEISPMEIAAAYATFANGGFRVRPTTLLGVVGPGGRKIEQADQPVVRAADADAIAVLDSVMRGVVDRGTGAAVRRMGVSGILAGKTGTTNDGRDAWFIGFSPRLLVAVWVGFDDNRGLNLSGSMAAVPIFGEFARRLPAQYLEVPFPTTPGTVTATIDPTTGYRVTSSCPSSFEETFVAGTEPQQRCPIHGGRDVEGEPPGEGVGVPF